MATILYNKTAKYIHPQDFMQTAMQAAENRALQEYIFIVPTFRLQKKLEQTLTETHFATTNLPIEDLKIYTFDSFINKFYDSFPEKKRLISPAVSLMLFEEAFRNAEPDFFAKKNRTTPLSVVERVFRVISGIRKDGIMPSNFDEDIRLAEIGEKGYDQAKLTDLKNIYSEYIKLLNPLWIDFAGQIFYLNLKLQQDPNYAFSCGFQGVKNIMIQGFNELTHPQVTLLQNLASVKDLSLQLHIDYAKENGPLYGNFGEMLDKLTRDGKYIIYDADPIDPQISEEERNPFNHHVRKNLFRTDDTIENSTFNNEIRVFNFENRDEECEAVASLVKQLHFEKNIPLNKICIAVSDIDVYGDIFREELAASGIPAVISKKFSLEQNGLITSIMSALNIPANNYDRRDMVRAVTSAYLNFGEEVNPFALVNVAHKLRISRGLNTWGKRIEQRKTYIEKRKMNLTDEDSKIEADEELKELIRAMESIDKVIGVFQELREFDNRLTPSEFRSSVIKIISKLRSVTNVLSLRHEIDSNVRTPQDWQRIHDEIERDTRALAAFITLLDEMTEHYEIRFSQQSNKQINDEQTNDKQTRDLNYYIERLKIGAVITNYRLREKNDYGVYVLPLEEMAGLEFDVVILTGIVDGNIPTAYIPENFLGKPLKASRDRKLREERIAFYYGITRYKQKLFITYPRLSAKDGKLVKSTFLNSLLKIITLEKSGNVFNVDRLSFIRDKARRGEPISPELEFLKFIITVSVLAEEVGAVIWSGGKITQSLGNDEIIENIKHTIEVAKIRDKNNDNPTSKELSHFEGIIKNGFNQREQVEFSKKKHDSYSISQFEEYAKCPFKYFTNRLLKVKQELKYDITLTPLERGQLIHSILFRLYSELREKNLLPITKNRVEEVLQRAKELAFQEFEAITIDHPYWKIDQERLVGSELILGMLRRWINYDVQVHEEGKKLVPNFFEVGFGSQKIMGESDFQLTLRDELNLHGIKIKGKIDRIEVYSDTESGEIYFLVADYKTGSAPHKNDIYQGLSLQLMVYIEAVRTLLANFYNLPITAVKPLGGIYYQFAKGKGFIQETKMMVPNMLKEDMFGKADTKMKEIQTIEDLEQVIEQSFNFTQSYLHGISDAEFGLTTKDKNKICGNCPYQTACRIKES